MALIKHIHSLVHSTDQQLWENAMLVLTQDQFATMHDGECLYRGSCCTKCSIGFNIADDEYDSTMEGRAARLYAGTDGYRMMFIEQLQRIHDKAASVWLDRLSNQSPDARGSKLPVAMGEFYYLMMEFARRHNLDTSAHSI